MIQVPLTIYNTETRKKETFEALNPPHVGLYVCGPTVYGDPHLGHARPAITFDLLFRYMTAIGYRVRYVRNITDVGHLENDADQGEDKIAKKARLEQLEPMEVAQYYTNRYRDFMGQLNVLPPSIEPQASGHIIEQIELVKTILANGFAYEANGSVYFDVLAYNKIHPYGKLSGRVLDDLMANTRSLDGQDDKRSPFDFAIWKSASKEHIMRWPSPWGMGFPGWHLECSAMSTKYLGETFDIHGGGMDLMFPHHECEIAQNVAAEGHEAAKYWMHNNMMTINGQKMGKSLGNFITLEEMFSGQHALLEQAYSPMTIRFFALQAHYRSTLDFSNEALKAAEKGLQRLMKANKTLHTISPASESTLEVGVFKKSCMEALSDDLNSPIAIAVLFEWVKIIHQLAEGKAGLTETDLKTLQSDWVWVTETVLGLRSEQAGAQEDDTLADRLIETVLQLRLSAKANKDYATADALRKALEQLGIVVKDTKEGFQWEKAGPH